jgi:RNA polymerase sigma-70 factor (ECF subfamily)
MAALLTLELLFRTEMDFVMNTARRCGLSDADAEDVTQQVFLALQRRLHTLHSTESVRPWLFTVTRRHAFARHGENRRAVPDSLPDGLGELEDDGPLPEERLLATEQRREILDLLERIEPGRRNVLLMHVVDELSMTEVAEALQIPVPTAYNRLRLARQELRDILARRKLSEEHDYHYRAWERSCTVRDPWEVMYGRAVITQAVRDRVWSVVLAGIERAFGSIEAAEVDGLRVLSPIWKKDAPPRKYARPRRPRNLATSVRVGLPPLPTESRTP